MLIPWIRIEKLGYDFWRKLGICLTFSQSVESVDEYTNRKLEEEQLNEEQIQQLEEVKKLFLVASPGNFGMTDSASASQSELFLLLHLRHRTRSLIDSSLHRLQIVFLAKHCLSN